MATRENKITDSTVVRRPARHRGALTSSDYNDFMEEVVHDLLNLNSSVNSLNNGLHRAFVISQNEAAYLRRTVDALRNQNTYVEKVYGSFGYLITRFVDISDTTGITYPNGIDDTYSAMVHAEFGEATLPANAIENKFYVTSLTTGKIIVPPDLVITVKGTFDKGEGDGLIDYEKGGLVSQGKPEWAVNGNNTHYWVRRVEFPIDSRVDEVECEASFIVPESSSAEANLVEVIPFPNGTVDVLTLATASDLGDNFITVPGFIPTDNLVARRYHFPATTVSQIRVRMRQRNWIEENGKKVFYYGLQELGLKLVDYDKKYTPGAPFGSNNTFVLKMEAPEGYGFQQIYRIDPDPNFFAEDITQRHIHVRLSSTADFAGQFWDSDANLPPQRTNEPISVGGLSVMYAVVQLNFVSSTGGSLSPFPVGTTPYFKGLGLSYTLREL